MKTMLGKKLLIPIVALVVVSFNESPKAVHQVQQRLICGKVIDERGGSVSGALVTLGPAALNPVWGADVLLPGALTEKDGAFCVEWFVREIKNADARLYVTALCRPGDITLVAPPFESLRSRPPTFTGRAVSLKSQREDVGDIRLQVIYPHIKLRILDRRGRPLLTRQEQWAPLWIRVKDRRGTVAHEGGLSPSEIESAVDLTQSSINLALPQGIWRVEIALEGIPSNVSMASSTGTWIPVQRKLVVTSCQNPTEISLMVGKSDAERGRRR